MCKYICKYISKYICTNGFVDWGPSMVNLDLTNVMKWKERQGLAIEQWRATQRGWRKQTRVRVGSLGLDVEANNVWMQWQRILTIWLWSQVIFSTNGKVFLMWKKIKQLWQSLNFCGREIQVQVLMSHNHRLEEIIFVKLFLSVLKSVYISAVQVYFCLCDQALWSEI